MGYVLVSLAARVAAVEALKGRTLAGELVVDTIGDLPPSDADIARCALAVATGPLTGGTLRLVVTATIYQRLVGPGGIGWHIAPPSASTERVLDVLADQVVAALSAGDSDWARALRDCCDARPIVVGVVERVEGAAQRVLTIDLASIACCVPASVLNEIDAAGERLAHVKAAMTAGPETPLAVLGLDCGIPAAEAVAIDAEIARAEDAAAQAEAVALAAEAAQ